MPKKIRPFTETEEQNLAHQWRMLEIDQEFSAEWPHTMERLVAARLDRTAFVAARMTALEDWERRRKLAQAKLNYQFDSGRRDHKLIARDTAEVISHIRAKVEMQLMADRLSRRLEDEQATIYDEDAL